MPNAPAPIRAPGPRNRPIFAKSDLKHYPHFDAPISARKAERIVTDPTRVASHAFFPFLLYHEQWQPYRSTSAVKPKKKSRPIRYAARIDAYIFSYYRSILSELYEAKLEALGIADCPIAYRRIPRTPGERGGKCNIDFAKDAFDYIGTLGNCSAIALDIKSYFEMLDHDKIKRLWCELLNATSLPIDHYKVFKNITDYSFVDQREVYRRLGYFGIDNNSGSSIEKYLVSHKEVPKQLCIVEDFREKICGGDPNLPSIVMKNPNDFGVPQGAPISDLIANFYLLYYDNEMNKFAKQRRGIYMRYSDDILLILPERSEAIAGAVTYASSLIKHFGRHLEIKDEKTCVVRYFRDGDSLRFEHVVGPQGKNGLEYLGFRFDGKRVYVRESTISRFFRKLSISARRAATHHVEKNPAMPIDQLFDGFQFGRFSECFARVRHDYYSQDDYKTWTFWTYLKRSAHTFGERGERILLQASNLKKHMRDRVRQGIERAYFRAGVRR